MFGVYFLACIVNAVCDPNLRCYAYSMYICIEEVVTNSSASFVLNLSSIIVNVKVLVKVIFI